MTTIYNNIQNFYNNCAAMFDEEQDDFAFVRIPEKEIISAAFDKILNSKQTVLEIGAGTGRFTLETAPRVKHITAVDISQNMLDRLNLKKEQNDFKNIDIIRGSFLEIDFKKKFDLVTSFSAIEYINDKEALFAKISNLIKPHGHLVLTTAHVTFFRFWGRFGNYFRQKVFMAAYSKKEMHRLLATNGFHVIEMKDLCMKSFFTKGILLFVHATK